MKTSNRSRTKTSAPKTTASTATNHRQKSIRKKNESNTITTRVKHIAVPIRYIHEQIEADRIKLQKIDTTLNIAYSGTKPNPSPTHFRQYDWAIGVQFYPPESSEHYKLLGTS
jgi:hypothetical protein